MASTPRAQVPCEPGFISGSGAANCTACERGTYSNPTLTACVACKAGRFGATPGLSTSDCSGNCLPGSYSPRYAAECTGCEPGRFAAAEGAKDACALCADYMDSPPNASV